MSIAIDALDHLVKEQAAAMNELAKNDDAFGRAGGVDVGGGIYLAALAEARQTIIQAEMKALEDRELIEKIQKLDSLSLPREGRTPREVTVPECICPPNATFANCPRNRHLSADAFVRAYTLPAAPEAGDA